jgi:hypothetical protein
MGERPHRWVPRRGRRSRWNVGERAVKDEVARRLIEATGLAFAVRGFVRQDRNLRLLVAEAAGLLDALTGVDITNPDERARRHLQELKRLAAQL